MRGDVPAPLSTLPPEQSRVAKFMADAAIKRVNLQACKEWMDWRIDESGRL